MGQLDKLTPVFRGFVDHGKLKLARPELFAKYLTMVTGEVFLTVKKPKRNRSLSQNAYLFICYTLISKHTGDTTEELHEIFKTMFHRKRVKIGGIELEVAYTTTKDSPLEFGEYIEKVRRFAAERLDIVIPDPTEVALT